MLMAIHTSVEVQILVVTQLGEVSLSVTGALPQVPQSPHRARISTLRCMTAGAMVGVEIYFT